MDEDVFVKGWEGDLDQKYFINQPTYFMSLFPLSVGVANCIEKLQQDFLSGGIGEEFICNRHFITRF
jgi:hypothetical protein